MRNLLVLFLALATGGCGSVSGGDPGAGSPGTGRTIDVDSAPAVSTSAFTIRVGEVWDRERLRREKARTHQRMREGMGDAAFEAMVAQTNATNPWIARFDTFTSHTFYRGAIDLHTDEPIVFNRGALLLTIDTGRDTITIADDGVAFMRHDSSPLQVLFTHDGPIRYDQEFNGLPLGSENRCNILVIARGRVLDVALDPRRFQVMDRR